MLQVKICSETIQPASICRPSHCIYCLPSHAALSSVTYVVWRFLGSVFVTDPASNRATILYDQCFCANSAINGARPISYMAASRLWIEFKLFLPAADPLKGNQCPRLDWQTLLVFFTQTTPLSAETLWGLFPKESSFRAQQSSSQTEVTHGFLTLNVIHLLLKITVSSY